MDIVTTTLRKEWDHSFRVANYYDLLAIISNKETYLLFFSNYDSYASELQENIEEMFHHY